MEAGRAQVGELTPCPYNESKRFDHLYMFGGMTRRGLPHLSKVPHRHVNRP